MSKSENSTTMGSSSKTSSKTVKTTNTSKLDDYILKNIKNINADKKHLKYDSTVRIIILNSLDEYTKNLLNNYPKRISEIGPFRLYEIEMKIKKLEIENDDFKLYLYNLNSLFTECNNEAKIQNKPELIGIAYSFTFLYDEKTFKGLKEDITKLSTIIKKTSIQHEDQINRVRNRKLPYNFNKKTNSNEYCQYCHKNGYTTDNCFFNLSNSPNNNYRGEKKNNNYKSRNKIKNKITSLSRKSSKRNFKFYDVNYEEQNNSDSDSDPSFDFCFNIATNIVKNNLNKSSITSRNIREDNNKES
ncbi:hypothetical protein H8356DRAFT_1387845 [Neocallimastix lanati (nom. inval.)]|nr:hypothetical protein H8356DRAFT_1387845 [Neocallimastix sp. JGI-2020a]